MSIPRSPASATLQEIDLVLDSMVRELTRLQAQVEVLQQALDEQSAAMPVVRLGTINESDDDATSTAGNGKRPWPWDSTITGTGSRAKSVSCSVENLFRTGDAEPSVKQGPDCEPLGGRLAGVKR